MNKKYSGYLLLALAIGIVLYQYFKYRVAPDFNVNELKLVTIEGKAYPITFKENKLLVAGLYTLASLVGISRVYQGEHWASDVVAGAAMGYAFGKLSYRLQTKNWTVRKKTSKKIVN